MYISGIFVLERVVCRSFFSPLTLSVLENYPTSASLFAFLSLLHLKLESKLRREKDLEIKKELNLLQVFMEHTPEVVYFKDLESRFIKTSKKFSDKKIQTSKEDIIGKTDLIFLIYNMHLKHL